MSTLLLNTLTGKTSAGSIVVTGEGGSTTTNLQQGIAKSWVLGTNAAALTDSKKAEWKTYRQALRDLPSKVTPKFLPNSPRLDESDFPTKPS